MNLAPNSGPEPPPLGLGLGLGLGGLGLGLGGVGVGLGPPPLGFEPPGNGKALFLGSSFDIAQKTILQLGHAYFILNQPLSALSPQRSDQEFLESTQSGP